MARVVTAAGAATIEVPESWAFDDPASRSPMPQLTGSFASGFVVTGHGSGPVHVLVQNAPGFGGDATPADALSRHNAATTAGLAEQKMPPSEITRSEEFHTVAGGAGAAMSAHVDDDSMFAAGMGSAMAVVEVAETRVLLIAQTFGPVAPALFDEIVAAAKSLEAADAS